MAKDLALDSQGDLLITNGDVVLIDSIRQASQIALRWVKGEWKFNESLGIDYFQSILVKAPDAQEVARLLREELLSVEGVESIGYCTVEVDRRTRKMTAKFRVIANRQAIESEVELNV